MSAARGSPRIFYGWYIVAAGVLCTFVGSGIGFYEVGVFIDPLSHAHGWSKGQVSFAVTLLFAGTGLMGIVIGRMLDQRGPRRIVLTGALEMSSALFLVGHLHALWQLYAVYLWMAVGYTCLSSIPVSWMVSRWFVRQRAFALSIALAGTSTAGTILVPISQGLIDSAGLTATTNALALLVLLVALPVGLFLVRSDPASMNLLPDGDTPLPATGAAPPPRERAWGRSDALHTTAFWAITVAFSVALVSQTAYLIHEISYLKGPLGQEPAAFAVSMTAIASVLGRFCVGVFGSRANLRQLAIGCFVVQSVSLLVLALIQQPVVLFVSTFVFGLTIGNVYMLQSLVTADCFGTRTYGTVYGMVSVLTLFGSAAGPSIASAAVTLAGGYSACFVVMALTGLVSVIVVRYARPALPAAPVLLRPAADAPSLL